MIIHTCFGMTQSQSFRSKVRNIEGICDEGTRNLVLNNESSLYRGFITQRKITYNLLARIQGTYRTLLFVIGRRSSLWGGGGGGVVIVGLHCIII